MDDSHVSKVERDRRPVSEVLSSFARAHGAPRITIFQLRDALGRRAYGPLLFAFAAINFMPVPPGVGIITAMPVVMVAAQLAWGAPTPLFPSWLGKRSFATADVHRALDRLLPPLKRVENLLRPRLLWLHGPLIARLVGALCLVLALVLFLPLPAGGNWPPALAIAFMSLAYFERDGFLTLLGLAVGLSCIILMWKLLGHFIALAEAFLLRL